MEGQIETKVGVANRGGGHSEETEPQSRIAEYLILLLIRVRVSLVVLDGRLDPGVGEEKRGRYDVEDDCTEEDESSCVTVAVHHHCYQCW